MKLYTFDNGDGVKRVGVELSGFPGLIRDVRDFGLPYRDMTDLIRHITPLEKERISDPEAALDGRPRLLAYSASRAGHHLPRRKLRRARRRKRPVQPQGLSARPQEGDLFQQARISDERPGRPHPLLP